MKTAKNYTAETAHYVENATLRMYPLLALSERSPLPVTTQEIFDYVNELLSKKEEAACDMATD